MIVLHGRGGGQSWNLFVISLFNFNKKKTLISVKKGNQRHGIIIEVIITESRVTLLWTDDVGGWLYTRFL